jgi:protein-S-isoprenylcysteine O-methyltransferase Ste14
MRVLLSITAVVWVAAEVRQALRRRPEATAADHGSRAAIRACVFVAVAGTVVARRDAPSATIDGQAPAAALGLALVWCGLGLRLWSFHTLGRYFTVTVQTSPDQPIISRGPYRVIRHPGYAGLLLAAIGLGFATDNWLALLAVAGVIALGLVYRITVEERALSRDLEGRYQSYAATRKRLIPYVW